MGRPAKTITEIIDSHVEKTNTCWIWKGVKNPNGYGQASGDSAHRKIYKALVGPIPEGLQLDHLCEVKLCVNPKHLEPVTPRENTLRSEKAPATINLNKTHCKHGHEFTLKNIYRSPQNPQHRECRACRDFAVKKYLTKKAG